MAIDSRRVILAAVRAALDDDGSKPKKKGKQLLPARRAILLGAGLMAAGRLAVGSRGRDAMASLQDRLADFEDRFLSDEEPEDEDEDYEDEDYEDDEEPVDEEDLDEEPEDLDEEPVDEEDLDEEPVDEEELDEEPAEDDEPVATE